MCSVRVAYKMLRAIKAYFQLNPTPNFRSGSSCAEPLLWLFLESPVIPRSRDLLDIVFQPSNALDLPYVEFRDVWFDIQQGSPVYNINILNMENPKFNPEETHYRKS